MRSRQDYSQIRTEGLSGEFVYQHWPMVRLLALSTPHGHAMRVPMREAVPDLTLQVDVADAVQERVVYLTVTQHYWHEPGWVTDRWLVVAPQSKRDKELPREWEREVTGAA